MSKKYVALESAPYKAFVRASRRLPGLGRTRATAGLSRSRQLASHVGLESLVRASVGFVNSILRKGPWRPRRRRRPRLSAGPVYGPSKVVYGPELAKSGPTRRDGPRQRLRKGLRIRASLQSRLRPPLGPLRSRAASAPRRPCSVPVQCLWFKNKGPLRPPFERGRDEKGGPRTRGPCIRARGTWPLHGPEAFEAPRASGQTRAYQVQIRSLSVNTLPNNGCALSLTSKGPPQPLSDPRDSPETVRLSTGPLDGPLWGHAVVWAPSTRPLLTPFASVLGSPVFGPTNLF
ncbi:hypothetical protein M885DRAFT_288188 [Pelagophyceae sp. CCMP2097]|nr:hypothetical protein M885DRAFT_288188 [Pelagophyceae sp. CCMP2097]|mmetsp:Transcript_24490/g.82459  ORF Transcript_24490/g.82459 Transcript_24490/m.82459 type:complete len:289 (+) Transcript_24490:162-1028(+)